MDKFNKNTTKHQVQSNGKPVVTNLESLLTKATLVT